MLFRSLDIPGPDAVARILELVELTWMLGKMFFESKLRVFEEQGLSFGKACLPHRAAVKVFDLFEMPESTVKPQSKSDITLQYLLRQVTN